MESQTQRDKSEHKPVEALTSIVGVAATIVGSIAALGLPAVAVQYHRLNIPLELITKEQALRAGILPAIVLGGVIALVYWFLRNLETLKSKIPKIDPAEEVNAARFSNLALSSLFRLGLTATALVFLTKKYIIWAASHISARFHQRMSADNWVIELCGVSFLAILLLVRILPKRLRRLLDAFYFPITPFRATQTAGDLARRTIRGFVQFFLIWGIFLWEATWIASHSKELDPEWHMTYFDILLSATIAGLFSACVVLFAEASDRLLLTSQAPGGDSGSRKSGLVVGCLGILLLYASCVSLYASEMYQGIPYAIGGGKPTAVTLWLDKKEIPQTAETMIKSAKFVTDGELVRWENTYLVHIDTEIVVVSGSDSPYASCVVLSAKSVKAMTADLR